MLRTVPFLTVALFLCASSVLLAQNKERQKFTIKGEIVGMQGNVLQAKASDGAQWLLKVEVKPEDMQLSGTAEKGWLAPGMFVSFTGKFDGRGNSQEPIAEVTVFTPREGTPLGVTEEASLGGVGNLFGGDGGEEGSKPRKKAADEISTYSVNGRVSGVSRDGKLNVVAGGTRLTIELADETEVKVVVSDPRLIRPGDKFEADGWYYQKGQGIVSGKFMVEAQPFTAPEDPKQARIRAREEAERGRRGGDAPKDEGRPAAEGEGGAKPEAG
ncbi:hypothetical protein LOC68_12020 [Blastopirellula sp. JC732]|uniref:DUF5666 domain-containing protein n=1 Tax=Blastopirellula sediminis TaxID=2894196 RepID=A0A9X1SFF3_9BACT|nr:hypothetical protein [Blastopirellula sediminis]MCC9607582.1 hypothetical protein [Blastopirellula sediminis]MCC9629125.1 hypothetical protein [Blastopirellula sediminis]